MGALIARLLTKKGEYRRVGCAWMRRTGVVCGMSALGCAWVRWAAHGCVGLCCAGVVRSMSALGWAVHGCASVPNNQKKRFCNRVFF